MSHAMPDIKAIFGHALEIDVPARRAAYLDEACGKNTEIRSQVERLLAALDDAGSFMKQPAVAARSAGNPESVSLTLDAHATSERPGTMIGPYRLMEQIGEGGMGIVFVAQQERPLRRKVALKVIKPGMDSKSVLARFDAERQALALMDHLNIARVFDAGTTEQGRPYFVMELVQGIRITDYCDQCKLTLEERLELFGQVCQAVQHAHQKGIIHRDLKPPNILVTEKDGQAIPKVIDFGVAKALNQRLTEQTIYTSFQQVIGTPLYMSPEQASLSAVDVDTRSDIYSLGVLLYELLTGVTPLTEQELKEAGDGEILRYIRETEPPRPSTRISTLGDRAAAVSQHRRTEPDRLGRTIRGDLDCIVMKALDKDRARRYESASSMAADVRRYLTNEPIEARPPSAAYQLRKFASRHKGPVFSAGLIGLALLLGLIGMSWLYVGKTVAEREARESAARAEKIARSLLVELKRKAERLAMNGQSKKKVDEAIDLAVAVGASSSWAKMTRGLQCLYAGDSVEAIRLLEEASEDSEGNVRITAQLATCYALSGQYDKFIRTTRKLIQSTANESEDYLFFAQAYIRLGKNRKAREMVQKVFDSDDGIAISAVARIVRAEVYAHVALDDLESKLIQQATRDVIVARELMPNSPYVYAMGMLVDYCGYELYQALDQPDRAAEHKQHGEELFADRPRVAGFPLANGLAAMFLDDIGCSEKAEREYENITPQGSGIWQVQHALFLVRQGRAEKALELLNQTPVDEAWARLVKALVILAVGGDKKESLKLLQDLPEDMDEQLHPLALGIVCLSGHDVRDIKARWSTDIRDSKGHGNDMPFTWIASRYYFDDQKDADWLLAQARCREEECLAHFCIAMRAFGKGNTELGKRALDQALGLPTTGPTYLLVREIPFAIPSED